MKGFTYTRAAIPTTYAGVNFRSRLEARWAAMFDLLKWEWKYEPIDLNGWSPDFLLDAGVIFGSYQVVFVEVKPIYELTSELKIKTRNAAKVLRQTSGLPTDTLCLFGNEPKGTILGVSEQQYDKHQVLQVSDNPFDDFERGDLLYRESYFSPVRVYPNYGSGWGLWSDLIGGGDYMDITHPKPTSTLSFIKELWKIAGNKIQWRR